MTFKDKALIFDSGGLITFSMNGIEELFEKLKREFGGRFFITREVAREVIERPLNNKMFELGALKIKKMLDDGIFELPEVLGIDSGFLHKKTAEVMKDANSSFFIGGKNLEIIQEGESSCLALYLILKSKGIESAIVVDERTTRMMGENPENLRKLFERKFHNKVSLDENKVKPFREILFLRSSELVYIAWKKKLVDFKDSRALDALLYATKFKGAAISKEEIDELKKLK